MTSKVIIVTGASRGIGRAVARHLLSASHKVVLVSRSQEELEFIKSQFPGQVEYLAADLTKFEVGLPHGGVYHRHGTLLHESVPESCTSRKHSGTLKYMLTGSRWLPNW